MTFFFFQKEACQGKIHGGTSVGTGVKVHAKRWTRQNKFEELIKKKKKTISEYKNLKFSEETKTHSC